MKVTDLMNHYKCETQTELAKKIGVSLVTLWKWQKGIPPRTQATFEVLSQGQLKADLKNLNV